MAGTDSDGDGVCDNDDCKPFDAAFPATPGTPCNDGDPNTNNDVVTADGCDCAGTPGGGGDPDCNSDINISTGNGTIIVSGLDGAPVTSLKVFNSSWGIEYDCMANCNATETVNVADGTYFVSAKYFTAAWSPICEKFEQVTVGGGGGPCANQGGDSDGDGVCNNQDCKPFDAFFPNTPGTPCNDGNPNTSNDVVTADGCNCQGSTTDPCANQGGDSDGDGVCDNQDCKPFNASFPATPGTPCNDGDPNTTNDVVTSDGCDCAGTPVGPDICIDRNVSNSKTSCGSGENYGFFAKDLISGMSAGRRYTLSNTSFTEYDDGTATFTARATNNTNNNVKFDISVQFTGRTSTGSPKTSNCYTINTSDWYYYTAMSGTATGLNGIAGGVLNLSLDNSTAFQLGTGANLNDEFEFGASAWLGYSIASHPNASGVSFVSSVQTDFNIRLSGQGNDPCDNNGGTGDCTDVNISGGQGQITVSGLDGSLTTQVQVLNSNWGPEFSCFATCGTTQTIPLPGGVYYVIVKYFDASYQVICEVLETVSVVNALAANSKFEFDVVKEMEHAEIIWIHNLSEEVESYVIERSTDGLQFDAVIADHPSKGGTSTEIYHAYDFAPAKGDNYYRVKMQLTDGTEAYSIIRKINYADLTDFSIFPNPANQFTHLNLESLIGREDVKITVFNNLGITIQTTELDEIYSKYHQMDLRDLKEGHYTIWITLPKHKPIARQLVIGRL